MKTFFRGRNMRMLVSVHEAARARGVNLYLVGGALRDLLLARGKDAPDFDFALRRGAIAFGRAFAGRVGAGFFVLDKDAGSCRAVKKAGGTVYTFDFTDFRGADLKADLLLRDFTINALAASLDDVVGGVSLDEALIDPWGGRGDIGRRLLRIPHRSAFRDDPLRVLRLYSFASMLGFKGEPSTVKAAIAARSGLKKVSGERIRDELFKILSHPAAARYFDELDRGGILEILFPEIKSMRGIGQGPYHHLDVWQHTLEAIRRLEQAMSRAAAQAPVSEYLASSLSGARSRQALLKLAVFLHDVGKPATMQKEKGRVTFHRHEWVGVKMTQAVGDRLKLARDEVQMLKTIVAVHLRPGYLADLDTLTPRAVFRFFRDCRHEAVGVLLLALADQRATCGPLHTKESHARHERTVKRLLKEYFKKESASPKPRLVNGDDVMRALQIGPSPLIGKILAELEELQAIGAITTKAQALAAAQKAARALSAERARSKSRAAG